MKQKRKDYNPLNDFILYLYYGQRVPVSKIKDRLLIEKGVSIGESAIRQKIRLYKKYYLSEL